ncbi:peptidoglycan-binding protein [Streptomyces sp. NPDC053079]|uniref:peptidoglycan-binding protein n=1 Tax=Streptomyces sp. NPDC053079 TaxID=3365697 RepID=UPI0037D96256
MKSTHARPIAAFAVSAATLLALTAASSPAAAQTEQSTAPTTMSPLACGRYNGTAITTYGQRNIRVWEVQCLLNNYSAYPESLNQDSDFGPATLTGVKWLQRCAGIDVDGEVGPDTWHALRTSPC